MTDTVCRSCGTGDLDLVIDFGTVPIADRLVGAGDPPDEDPRAPLALTVCGQCGLVQLAKTVDPSILFDGRYPYLSSISATLTDQAKALAERLIAELSLDPGAQVTEIASNDGYLLRHFQDAGIGVLGIDPAGPAVEAAKARGIPTLSRFFDPAMAAELAADGHAADLIIANNVLAHVPDIQGFLAGIRRVLKPSGRAVFEVQWLHDLVVGNAFDTVYHQHVFYFSLSNLLPLLSRFGLTVLEVERIPAQGGSLRLHAGRDGQAGDSVAAILFNFAISDMIDQALPLGLNSEISLPASIRAGKTLALGPSGAVHSMSLLE